MKKISDVKCIHNFVFQAVEGSMQQLLDALVAMDRQDAVKVVRESFKYHRHATFQGMLCIAATLFQRKVSTTASVLRTIS